MELKFVLKATAAAALGLVLVACGGGGSDGGSAGGGGTTSNLQVSGTAATGAALAGASVQVKCSSGSGTATTSSAGAYTVVMEGGALPCLVQVTGTAAGGAAVTLHSVVDTGTSGTGGTDAVANVTPITEMIVAQLLKEMPADAFAAFEPAAITQAALATATTTIVNALKTAGIDLGTIDPLKGSLVPPGGTAAQSDYDKLLDSLGDTLPPEALPQVVNQIANAASSGSSEGLQGAMAGVEGGTLPGCPTAVSGRYRTQEFFGRVQVRNIDFKAMKFSTEGSSELLDIVQDTTDACKFKVTSVTAEFEAVIGSAGMGSFKAVRTASPPGVTGYIFPAQSHPLSAFAGDWNFVQSGFVPDEGLIHWGGKLTAAADGKASACDYDDSGACVVDTEADFALAARSDGGVDLNEAGQTGVANLWGYKAPNGSFTVFGTTNAAGATGGEIEETHLVLARPTQLPLPAVGAVNTAWSVVLRQTGDRTTRTVTAPTIDTNTVTAVDVAASSYTRDLEGQVETIFVNKPADGFRKRVVTSNGLTFYQMPLPGTGLTVGFNAVTGPSVASPYVHVISVNKP